MEGAGEAAGWGSGRRESRRASAGPGRRDAPRRGPGDRAGPAHPPSSRGRPPRPEPQSSRLQGGWVAPRALSGDCGRHLGLFRTGRRRPSRAVRLLPALAVCAEGPTRWAHQDQFHGVTRKGLIVGLETVWLPSFRALPVPKWPPQMCTGNPPTRMGAQVPLRFMPKPLRATFN